MKTRIIFGIIVAVIAGCVSYFYFGLSALIVSAWAGGSGLVAAALPPEIAEGIGECIGQIGD